jgi:hypothetical protein
MKHQHHQMAVADRHSWHEPQAFETQQYLTNADWLTNNMPVDQSPNTSLDPVVFMQAASGQTQSGQVGLGTFVGEL